MPILKTLRNWWEQRYTLADGDPVIQELLGAKGTSASGVKVNADAALGLAAVYSCVNVLARTLGATPLKVYERQQPRGKKEAKGHRLYDLLHVSPNPEQTAFSWKETMQGHLALTGNAYSELVYNNGGELVQIWPLIPQNVRCERVGKNLFYFVRVNDREHRLPAHRVLHLRGLSRNGMMGLSPVKVFMDTFGHGLALQEYSARFFSNSASPGGVIKHPMKMTTEGMKNLTKSWEDAHSGLSNAHRVAILEEGAEWQSVGLPPEQAQFIETLKLNRSFVAGIFNMPPHMVGDLERATFSNIEHQDISFGKHTMAPWFSNWEQQITLSCLSEKERSRFFVEFNMDSLLRGDTASRNAAYQVARQNGWMSANDIREKENMNPLPPEVGDVYLVPANMYPADVAGSLTPPAPKEPPKEEPTEEEPTRSVEWRGAPDPRLRIRQTFAPMWREAANRVIKRERADVMRAAEKHLASNDMGALRDYLRDLYENHPQFVKDVFGPVVRACATSLGDAINHRFGLSVDLEAPTFRDFVEAYLHTFSSRWVGSSQGQVEQILNENPDSAIEALSERFDGWEETRANKTAGNEGTRLDGGISKTIFAASAITTLVWRAHGESCPYCRELNGRVVGIDQTFLEKGTTFQPEGAEVPLYSRSKVFHPPIHRGCDCSIEPAY